jgi:alpha-L-fucosidase
VFPQAAIDRLKDIGSWMSKNSESIYGTKASPFQTLAWGRCTQKPIAGGTRLYLHVFDWPAGGKLIVPNLGSQVTNSYVLGDKKKLKAIKSASDYVIDISNVTKQDYATVIVVDVKGKSVIYDAPEIKSSSNIFTSQAPVSFSSKIPNAVIHYTTNGEEPRSSSPVAAKTLLLKSSTTVKARSFLYDKPITETTTRSFEKVAPVGAVDIASASPGLNYVVYNGEWSKLPDFDSLRSVVSGVSHGIDISSKKGSEKYGFIFEGFIKVPADGVYNFFISSDDGSKLFIDGNVLVDNDGLHGSNEKNAETPLAKGYHPIKILFFQNTGGDDLQVQWKGPGFEKQLIPAAVLFRK